MQTCSFFSRSFGSDSPCRSSPIRTSVAELACAWKLRRGVPSPRSGSQWPSLPSPWSGWSGCRLQGQEGQTHTYTHMYKHTHTHARTGIGTGENSAPVSHPSQSHTEASTASPPGGDYCSSFWQIQRPLSSLPEESFMFGELNVSQDFWVSTDFDQFDTNICFGGIIQELLIDAFSQRVQYGLVSWSCFTINIPPKVFFFFCFLLHRNDSCGGTSHESDSEILWLKIRAETRRTPRSDPGVSCRFMCSLLHLKNSKDTWSGSLNSSLCLGQIQDR